MTQLETKLVGKAPKTNDIHMSRTTKNYLAGLDLAERVRTVEFIKTLPKKYQDSLQEFLESSQYHNELMTRILNANETV
jgi:HPt (histidine-containing phosphotransfer) domain-containing protein